MVMGDLPVETQVLVLGAGPGGYAAAFRAADLGLDVTLVSDEPVLGGVCLQRGCIPSKALLQAAETAVIAGEAEAMGLGLGEPQWDLERLRGWKDGIVERLTKGLAGLCEARGIQRIQGRGRFAGPRRLLLSASEYSSIDFEQAIIATGSQPLSPPGLSASPQGRIMDSTGALALADIPERLLVVGGGYVGLELGSVYAALGARVSLVEQTDRLLPGTDPELVEPLRQQLEQRFERIALETSVRTTEEQQDRVSVRLEDADGSREQSFERVLVAIGRRPNTSDLGLDEAGIETDDQGFIKVNAERGTSTQGIFAIGDVAGGQQLAHEAMHEGRVAAEVIAGRPAAFDARAIPAVIYTDPQIAWCGLSEAEAEQQGRQVSVTRFPWQGSGRALSLGAEAGLTKLIMDPDSGRLLGAGLVGRGAEGLIAEAVLAIEMGALAEDLSLAIHPHPTLSETLGEAAELFAGNSLHGLAGAHR
ncbi:dihydrolipoyl dehydrogenase [Halochromatium salexigens]|uniref:Dihydrolipoyl dehydrogenase n=2 Tax=Halochromatium salexigens TaxID=49447 RepID=A0AAJ0UL69_HALSE|nr:dihydrolipoyl dehydrogenase [Halochromatium salexigens]